MAITGIGSSYNNVYESTYASQKNETAKKTETKEAESVQAGDTRVQRQMQGQLVQD